MALTDLVIRKLIPPRLAGPLDYPLPIVQAGTGHGQSTTAQLSRYTITDPLLP